MYIELVLVENVSYDFFAFFGESRNFLKNWLDLQTFLLLQIFRKAEELCFCSQKYEAWKKLKYRSWKKFCSWKKSLERIFRAFGNKETP